MLTDEDWVPSGDNNDWFVFEQTIMPVEQEIVYIEFDTENLWKEMTKEINHQDEWDMLTDEDWDALIQMQRLQDSEIDAIVDELFQDIDPMFQQFMDSLDSKDVKEFTPDEISQMASQKTASEFKLLLDKLEDHHDIVHIFKSMTEEERLNYFYGLTEADWRSTTPSEWQSYVVFLDSQGFKMILDGMNAEEILYVFGFFDERMEHKFFSGLTEEDMMNMTLGEWQASLYGLPPSEFKHIYFDRMNADQICYVAEMLGDMSPLVDGLTERDWIEFTPAEWDCFLRDQDIADLIDFIHEMHEINHEIVYTMFRNMPEDLVDDFRVPELENEFSDEEKHTMRRGVNDSFHYKESVMDFEDFKQTKRDHRRGGKRFHGGKGKKGQHGRKHRGEGKNEQGPPHPEFDGEDKPRNGHHGPRDGKKHRKGERRQHRQEMEQEFENFDDAYAYMFDDEEFRGFDGFDEMMDDIREAEARGESEGSTFEDEEGDYSFSDSDDSSSDSWDSSSDSWSSSDDSDSDSDSSDSEEESRGRRRGGRRGGKRGGRRGPGRRGGHGGRRNRLHQENE